MVKGNNEKVAECQCDPLREPRDRDPRDNPHFDESIDHGTCPIPT